MKKLVALVSVLLWVHAALAQPNHEPKLSLALGSDIPVTYSLGVDVRWSPRWSTELRGHLLTAPYDRAIVGVAEAFGMSDTLGRAIESAFRFGLGVSLSGRYHFGRARRHHVRLSGQYLHLDGGSSTAELLEAAFGRSFNALRAPQPGAPPPLEVYLQCDLWMIGAYYGYDLPLGSNSLWALRLEFGLAKVVGSTSRFSSNRPRLDDTRLVQALYADVQGDLTTAFADYGYAPSLNVHVTYTFGGRGAY